MISEGLSYVIRHRSGRYLWVRGYFETDAAGCHIPGLPMRRTYGLVSNPMLADRLRIPGALERLIADDCWDQSKFEIVLAPVCACCGDSEPARHANGCWSPYRCREHADRNPCVIEGCMRTRAANGRLNNNLFLCRDHWRAFCPPRSLRRRAYLAFFRRARKLGFKDNDRWPDELEEAFWKFWRQLISNARHKASGGNLDLVAIERMFGV